MALVQKRPYIEPTTTVQIDITNVDATKRIRLQAKSSTSRSVSNFLKRIESCTNSNETLQILVEISDCQNLDEITADEIRSFSALFRKEEDFVRVKILYLFSDFVLNNECDATLVIEEILSLAKSEESSKVINQAFRAMYRIGEPEFDKIPQVLFKRMIEFAKLKLNSINYNVHRHAVQLMGAFGMKGESGADLMVLISCYMDSSDARTRAQAINSLLVLGSRGIELPASLYHKVEKTLKDDYECCRREALQLVFELSQRHPEFPIIIPDSQTEIRLVDDAFGKICSAISDISMQVRAKAAELLGQMWQVNNEFLFQTLDKKLMSNMRKKKTAHERALENFASGEWSSGRKWADDAPQEHINIDSISLIDSGACGAIVQGLEDEFYEVRLASVNSLCQLALINPAFAQRSLDSLVDMFNDEIENVRLQAIYSLTIISKHIVLRDDQIEVMLGSLEDYSVEVREGLHLMLGACKVLTRSCLTLVLNKVLDVLSKYPQDKLSAFGCMQKIGMKHPELCMSLTPQLIADHPFFDGAEQDVEDPAYICRLIMLFNAAKNLPPMLSLFPDIILKHYDYLRDTMPHLVPHLPVGNQSVMALGGTSGSHQFLETLLSNLKATNFAKTARQSLLQAAQENLDRLSSIDPELLGTAIFSRDILGAQLLMEQLHINVINNRVPPKETLNRLINCCLRMQNLYSNLTIEDQFFVKQICLKASALNLVLVVKDKSQSALSPCQLLLHFASNTQAFLKQNPTLPLDSFSNSLLSYLDSISDPKPGRISRGILPLIQNANMWQNLTPINFKIKMCGAKIVEPEEARAMETVIKVTAGLIAALPINVEIEHLEEHQKQDLRIKIKYPDQAIHVKNIVKPRIRDLKKMINENGNEVENCWRLRSNVLLSHGIWTETSQVELTVCLAVKPSHELDLCKPIKINFAPKPPRKGL